MARIPLRVYNREIEGLIEHGQIEEAIAHCKNILKQLPKHIDTYRLLGKAFLESQRYTEAVDILQRVLSVYPDDFVSQLGMSIIREDEGNLDAAIWHMERAYEVQPFNRAVQDELRRLYGRRDGVEPPKIRLNRGSLVRMYARGELYPQAIAEARAALAEDPQRTDLLVLLARMYYLSGQKVEAAEIASTLIGKLPHCYEANRILQEILPSTSRAEEAKSYQQRVYALSPYMAYLTPNAPTVEQVPDQSVMIEKVDWQPGLQEQQGPDWARTIGVQWEQKEEEHLPDWLSTLKSEDATPTSQSNQPAQPTQPAAEGESDAIPDWMKTAGWGQSTGSVQEGPVDFSEEETPEVAPAEAVPSEIPDWLQSMAPAQMTPPDEEKNQLEWLDSILPGAAAAATVIETQPESTSPEEATEGLDWLTQTPPAAETESETPDWLSPEAAQPAAEKTSDLDWLTEQPSEQAAETTSADMPTWIDQTAGTDQASSEEIPDWLQESPQPAQEAAPGEIPDWLASMSAEAAPTEDATEKSISWAETGQADEEQPATEFPSWLEEASPIQSSTEAIAGLEEPAAEAAEVPAWLQELQPAGPETTEPPTVAETTAETLEEPAAEAAEVPTWLQETQIPVEDTAPQAADSLGEMPEDMDAALAWMEALAARQGADEASLQITAPEDRSTETPDWIKAQGEEPVQIEASEEPQAGIETPAWLQETVSEEVPLAVVSKEQVESAEEAVAEAADVPDWLKEMAPTEAEPLVEATSEAVEEPIAEAADVPDWLKEIAPTEAAAEVTAETVEETLAQPVEELPEWLQQAEHAVEAVAEEKIETPTAAAEMGEMPEDMDAALAWMEALAARQGADEASLQITAPEDRSTETPDWIKAQGEEPVQAEASEEPLAGIETPAWLQETVTEEVPLEAVSEEQVESAEEAVVEAADVPDWLKEIAPTEAAAEATAETAEETLAEQVEELPEWLQQAEPAAEAVAEEKIETPTVAAEMGEMPEDLDAALAWMEALAARQGADEASLQITAPEDRSTETPDWIKAQGIEEPVVEAQAEVETLEWMKEVASKETQVEATAEELAESAEEAVAEPAVAPDWLQEVQPIGEATVVEEQPAAAATAEMGEMPEDLDAALAWMEALAARQGADAASLQITAPEDRSTETPDWIKDLPTEPVAEVSDFVADAVEEVPAPDVSGVEVVEVAAETLEAEIEPMQEIPETVADEFPVEPALTLEDTQPTHPVQPVETTEVPPAESVADEDFAWLESLAARQGADEATLVTPAAEREETPPQWVTGTLNAATLEQAEAQRAEAEKPDEAMPEWLRTYDEQPTTGDAGQPSAEPIIEPEAVPSVEDLPDWLKADVHTQDQQVDTWLESLEEPAAAKVPVEAEPVPQPSEWIQEPEFTAPTPTYAPAEPGSVLAQAEEALAGGNLNAALEHYNQLINDGSNIEETIRDLRDALYRHPVDVSLWQTLGDAYIRNDQVQDALDAYTKAEELLR